MQITGDQLQSWAAGRKTNAVPTDEEGNPGNPEDELGLEDEEGMAPENPIWAGEKGGDEVTPEEAEELLGWLEENEPEIHDAVTELAKAVTTGDARMEEHAKEELASAAQNLNPEYEEMKPAERSVMPVAIESRMEEAGTEHESPEGKLALAQGIADVRHAAGPTPGKEWEDLPKGWTEASRAKFYESVGGSFDACVAKMQGEGLEDPDRFCGALKGQEE